MRVLIIISFLLFGGVVFAQNYGSFEELKNEIISRTVPLITEADLNRITKSKKPLLILDAREENEYNVSHIKMAKHIGYNDFKISELKVVDKNMVIVVYCSVGYRSEKIGEQLKKAGFKKVMNLHGGIFGWVNSGFPVYDNSNKTTLKIHAYDKAWGKWLKEGVQIYD